MDLLRCNSPLLCCSSRGSCSLARSNDFPRNLGSSGRVQPWASSYSFSGSKIRHHMRASGSKSYSFDDMIVVSCRASDAPKFSEFLSPVQSPPAEEEKTSFVEGLSAKERRKLRNERREELKATKEPWKEMVEEKLLAKPKRKAKNWEVDTDVSQLTTKGMQWWMIQTTRKFENQVAEQLEIIFPERFPDREFEVLVPTMPLKSKLKDGTVSDSRKKIFQGIVLLRCIMDRDVYDLVRHIPRAYDFFGNLVGVSYQPMIMPAPVSHTNLETLFRQIKKAEEEFEEFKEQCKQEAEEERKRAAEEEIQEVQDLQLEVGATITVLSGPFTEFTGIVIEMLPEFGKVKALVTVFGKDTPIVLDVAQVDVTVSAPK